MIPFENFSEGDKVRVIAGPHKGIEGVVKGWGGEYGELAEILPTGKLYGCIYAPCDDVRPIR